MDHVITVTTGSEAVENAIKAAFIRFAALRRGGPPTEADLAGCMLNDQPDTNRMKVLSFEGGFYLSRAFMPLEPYRIFNTFMGDPLRGAQLSVICEVIARDHLLQQVQRVGKHLLARLDALQTRHPDLLSGARAARRIHATSSVPHRDRLAARRFLFAKVVPIA